MKTYAIGFGGGNAEAYYNELPYARRVAQLFHTDHHEIIVRPDVVALLPQLLWHLDEPIADTAFITTYLVSQFARREVTVILSGVGGDELFGGYRRYLGSHYQALFRSPAARVAARRNRNRRESCRAIAIRRSSMQRVSRRASCRPQDCRSRSVIGPTSKFFQRTPPTRCCANAATARTTLLADAFAHATSADELNRMFAVDAETQLPDDLLLLTDKMSMAVSLECRVPLLDHDLVELAARMPQEVKIRGGRLKHAMKAALQDVLPPDILERKKRGFGAPMGAWLKGDLVPLVRNLLSEEAVNARGLFRYPAIGTLVAAHAANRVDGTDRLLALINLEIWARMFLDGRSPDDVADELKEHTA